MKGRIVILLTIFVWVLWGIHAGVDEYGRSTLAVLILSAALSIVRGLLLVIPITALVILVVSAAEIFEWKCVSLIATPLTRAIESVPSYLWVLASIASASALPLVAAAIALGVSMLPFGYVTMRAVMRQLLRQSFVHGAILSGLPRRVILLRHVLPHLMLPAASLGTNMLGMAIAAYGAIGAFGFANRQTLDVGTLLLRGRENAAIDPALLWLSLSGYVLLFLGLRKLADALWRRAVPSVATSIGK